MPHKRAIAAVPKVKCAKLCYHDTTCYSILTISQGALLTLEAPPSSFQRLADRVRDDREMSVDTYLKASTAQRLDTS